jgi:mannose-6-phosphate isomerase-like protein (cupin superfamily)
MRGVKVALPHYHKNGETEIYFVIQGLGLTVVGGKEIYLEKGSVVVTPPNTTHFTIPKRDLVMMVINTPNFNAENIVEPTDSDPNVKFDKEQYDKLVHNI